MPTSHFQPIRLLDPDCSYKFTQLMANSVNPDQLASSEHCLQRQDISGFSRTRVKCCILGTKMIYPMQCKSQDITEHPRDNPVKFV